MYNRFSRIVAVVVILVMAIGTIVVLVRPSASGPTTVKTNIIHDPASGQIFVTQPGVTPEQTGSNPSVPLYAGFDALFDSGFSTDQVAGVQSALARYKPFASSQIRLGLDVSNIQSQSPPSSDPLQRWSVLTRLTANEKITYVLKMYYWGISTIQLQLYDNTGTTELFDSGVVTGSS